VTGTVIGDLFINGYLRSIHRAKTSPGAADYASVLDQGKKMHASSGFSERKGALQLALAGDAVIGPGHCCQPFRTDGFAAFRAKAVFTLFQAGQRPPRGVTDRKVDLLFHVGDVPGVIHSSKIVHVGMRGRGFIRRAAAAGAIRQDFHQHLSVALQLPVGHFHLSFFAPFQPQGSVKK
jgi:hypothetical protein